MAYYTQEQVMKIAEAAYRRRELDRMVDPVTGYTVGYGLSAPQVLGGGNGDRDYFWKEKVKPGFEKGLSDKLGPGPYSSEQLSGLLSERGVDLSPKEIDAAAKAQGITGQEAPAVASAAPAPPPSGAVPERSLYTPKIESISNPVVRLMMGSTYFMSAPVREQDKKDLERLLEGIPAEQCRLCSPIYGNGYYMTDEGAELLKGAIKKRDAKIAAEQSAPSTPSSDSKDTPHRPATQTPEELQGATLDNGVKFKESPPKNDFLHYTVDRWNTPPSGPLNQPSESTGNLNGHVGESPDNNKKSFQERLTDAFKEGGIAAALAAIFESLLAELQPGTQKKSPEATVTPPQANPRDVVAVTPLVDRDPGLSRMSLNDLFTAIASETREATRGLNNVTTSGSDLPDGTPVNAVAGATNVTKSQSAFLS